jgi:hypothetical protein
MPHIRNTFVLHSPFYINSHFPILPYNQLRTSHSKPIHPVPAPAKPHPTPEEPTPALQQREHAQMVYAQPPPTLSRPTTQANPAAAQPEATTKVPAETLGDQKEQPREGVQREEEADTHTIGCTPHHQREQHGRAAPAFPVRERHERLNE